MQNNICPECKTENESEYRYCKNCGAPILSGQSDDWRKEKNQSFETSGSSAPDGIFIDGNPIDKVYTFVGKNAPKIVPKFIKMNESGSKTEWCWPPFIWGFFLGPIGVMIWLLYRKMYKPAVAFAGLAVVIRYIMSFLDYVFGIGTQTLGSVESYFSSLIDKGTFDISSFISTITDRKVIISSMANSFVNLLSLACAIVIGLFGFYMYKNHTAKKIARYTPVTNDPNYVKIGLASIGGTSVGSAILGVVVVSIVSNIPSMIFDLIKLSGV